MPSNTRWGRIATIIGIAAVGAMLLLAIAQARGANAELLTAMSSVLSVAFAAVAIVVGVGLGSSAKDGATDPSSALSTAPTFPFGSINIVGNGADLVDLKLDRDGVGITIAGNGAERRDACARSMGSGLDHQQGERGETEDAADDGQQA